jgi:hypothetical protein
VSNSRLVFEGLDDFRNALRNCPRTWRTKPARSWRPMPEGADRETVAGYPTGPTGNLKSRVTIEKTNSRVSTTAIVRSRAPHAFIFEKGTKRRQTNKGWNRGRMPAASEAQAMVPKVVRWRRKMTEALIELVRRAGFEVTA